MKILGQEIAKIEASIDKYNEADTEAIAKEVYKSEAVEPLLRTCTRTFGLSGESLNSILQGLACLFQFFF